MRVFLQITSGVLAGTRLLFPPGQYLFGRAEGCHVLFAASSVASRRHCLMQVTKNSITIRDLSSRNGTIVNSERLSGDEVALDDGDVIGIAETTFRVEVTSGECSESETGIEVTGKPLGETIDVPLDRTAPETHVFR